jgi:acyl-CoA hydrolase
MESAIDGTAVSSTYNTASYRESNRFKGHDYIHSSPAVKLGDYYLFETLDTDWYKVEASVQFTPNAEGAASWVHRGTLCALMDDAANFAGFCVSGNLNLFAGFTKKVYTDITRPVRVGSILKLVGQIVRVENRSDVIVKCQLIDPAYSNAVHVNARCVFAMNESAAEALEPIVARRQKKRANSGATADKEWEPPNAVAQGSGNSWDHETVPDPLFRPPNRVGRYGLGTKIDEELAQKIDDAKIRAFVPNQGSLLKNAERNATKVKLQKEEQRRQLEEERERERAKNHPARSKMPWGNHNF